MSLMAWSVELMVVRLRSAVIESIENTETKRLKLIQISSKEEGALVSIELPEALCDTLKPQDSVVVVMDSKPLVKGAKSKLYIESKVFRTSGDSDLNVVGTVGGLRLTVSLSKPTTAQRNTFDSERIYFIIQ